jgi:hypothetical protein
MINRDRLFPGISIIILMIAILYGCANVVAPTGGPKDEDPPVVIRSTPSNYSAHYRGQDIRVYFNEFVELKNLRQNLLVSPPLAIDPEVRIKGKSIIISMGDTLRANTTYNFFFGESVVDLTEGNPIPNFQFIVSTGAYVDSLSVRGTLVNAFTKLPEEGVFIMMHEATAVGDSTPMLQRPVYVSKTNKQGNFTINNMRDGEYLMFALKDMNSTYKYDNPDELIAFHPTLVSPTYLGLATPDGESLRELLDTLKFNVNDSEGVVNGFDFLKTLSARDSLDLVDSLLRTLQPEMDSYQLRLFKEKDNIQRVLSASLARQGLVNIIFRIPVDSAGVRDYINQPQQSFYIPEYSRNRDTLRLWIAEPPADTLFLEISDRGNVIDSVRVSMIRRADRARPRPGASVAGANLTLTAPTVAARIHPYYRRFELRAETPIKEINHRDISLYLNDTVPVPVLFEFTDNIRRTLRMDYIPAPDSSYVLVIQPGALTDIFNTQNDTLRIPFKVNNETSYGSVILSLILPEEDPEKHWVLQLVSDNLENIINERVITRNGTYRFDNLPAATFKFRLIEDHNANGKWDTGNYILQMQPEQVIIFPDKVQSRLNWEVEVTWDTSNINR